MCMVYFKLKVKTQSSKTGCLKNLVEIPVLDECNPTSNPLTINQVSEQELKY